MIRFALVNTTTNLVENVVEYDSQPSTPPPGYAANYLAFPSDTASPGWTWNGTTVVAPPPPPPVPPPIPQIVSAMQAKVALSRAGLLPQVQAWVNSQSAEAQLIWNSASSFSRNSALLNAAGAALNLTPAQIDQLFTTAAGINP